MPGLIPTNTNDLLRGLYGLGPATPTATAPTSPTSTYNAALKTQGGDYDKIMAGYDNLMKPSNQFTFNPITPQTTPYTPSPQTTTALSNLSDLATTGGYSDSDIANIRARGVSPIRSIYANAQRNVARQKNLQGGYSPNYGAVQSKMAREMSSQLADKSTDVEGMIADARAKNKLSIAPSFASLTSEIDRSKQASDQANTEAVNRANEFNSQMGLNTNNANFDSMFKSLEGQRGLYGTSPALLSLFANQVQNAQQMAQQDRQYKNPQQPIPYSLITSMIS